MKRTALLHLAIEHHLAKRTTTVTLCPTTSSLSCDLPRDDEMKEQKGRSKNSWSDAKLSGLLKALPIQQESVPVAHSLQQSRLFVRQCSSIGRRVYQGVSSMAALPVLILVIILFLKTFAHEKVHRGYTSRTGL